MKIRAYVNEAQVGQTFARALSRYPDRIRWAARAVATDLATEMETLGRQNISGAGKFGSRWTQGLHADISEGGGNIKIDLVEDVPYWKVFEYGATIRGKPMLWIPLSFAPEAQGVLARDYPGGLFRVDRSSDAMRWRGSSSVGPRSEPTFTSQSGTARAPLLFSREDKKPKYFGRESVTISRKFALREITRSALSKMPLLFRTYLKDIASLGG